MVTKSHFDVFGILLTNQMLPKFKLFFSSGHFAYFENVPSAACHCKQLARETGTSPAVELLNFCKKDTSSALQFEFCDIGATKRQAQ